MTGSHHAHKRQKVLDIINSESNVSLFTLKYEGIDIWPIVKSRTFLRLVSQESIQARSPSKWSKVKRVLVTSIDMPEKTTDFDVLFVANKNHRTNTRGKSYNRYFDPLIKVLDTANIKANLVEVDNFIMGRLKPMEVYGAVRYTPFRIFKAMSIKKNIGYFINESKSLIEFFYSVSKEFSVPLDSFLKDITNSIWQAYTWANIGENLFSKHSVKDIFFLCYYDPRNYGLIVAANSRGIRTWDFQHGSQGSTHIAYHFSESELQFEYNSLPKGFWTWDDTTGNNLKQVLAKSKQNFRVFVGGNPDLRFKQKPSLKSGKLTILFTLQPFTTVIEDFILEVIGLTCKQYNWVLKEHPRYDTRMSSTLKNKLREFGLVEKVEISGQNSNSLGYWLETSDIHISYFSGSIVEAKLAGVINIVLDKLGLDQVELDDSVIPCLDHTPESLLSAINKAVQVDMSSRKMISANDAILNLVKEHY